MATLLWLSDESLKMRVTIQSPAATSAPYLPAGSAFVEVGVPSLPDQSHCLLEIESEAGCKLNVQLLGRPYFY